VDENEVRRIPQPREKMGQPGRKSPPDVCVSTTNPAQGTIVVGVLGFQTLESLGTLRKNSGENGQCLCR